MTSTLAGKQIAILIANGFDENQMTEIQRALVKVKANFKTIAPENGVVNGWQDNSWGHYFPVNAPIGEALGSDFDALVIPGGERSINKLKTNLHARRIINHFFDADKPVAAIGAGVGLLALAGSKLKSHSLAAPTEAQAELQAAGAIISAEVQSEAANLLTATGADLPAFVAAALSFFADAELEQEAA